MTLKKNVSITKNKVPLKKPRIAKAIKSTKKSTRARKGTLEEQATRDRLTALRSFLRRCWSKYPERYKAKTAAMRPNQGPNKKLKYEYQCNICKNWYQWLAKKAAQKAGKIGLSVDHIVPCGQLLADDDIGVFVMRLFCASSGLQVLCDTCHNKKTYEERWGEKNGQE